jgi:hypothetical protein
VTTIKLRRGSSADWANVNPILADGEKGIELDTMREKVGDGTSHWNDLEYILPVSDIQALIDASLSTATGPLELSEDFTQLHERVAFGGGTLTAALSSINDGSEARWDVRNEWTDGVEPPHKVLIHSTAGWDHSQLALEVEGTDGQLILTSHGSVNVQVAESAVYLIPDGVMIRGANVLLRATNLIQVGDDLGNPVRITNLADAVDPLDAVNLKTLEEHPGTPGPAGPPGTAYLNAQWNFNQNTAVSPASGTMRMNGTTYATTTVLWVSETDRDGLDRNAGLNVAAPGDQIIMQSAQGRAVWTIVANADSGVYRTFTVTLVESSGTRPSASSPTTLYFASAGTPIKEIQDEGTTLTNREKVNFVGAGVTATDDAANKRTVVTIPGGTPTTRTLTAGAGLTGGGDLSADRTFNVGAGAGITVAADAVSVTAGTYWGLWTGTQAAFDAIGTKDPNVLYVVV